MEKQEIKKQVNVEVKRWLSFQKIGQQNVVFSPKAIDFICLMIENIEEDKSKYWDYNQTVNNHTQQLAITLIPEALNNLKILRGFHILSFVGEINISSWEIWHSLSEIVDKYCFISKGTEPMTPRVNKPTGLGEVIK